MYDDRTVPKVADKTRLEVLLSARSQPRQVRVVEQGEAPKCLLFGARPKTRSNREVLLNESARAHELKSKATHKL